MYHYKSQASTLFLLMAEEEQEEKLGCQREEPVLAVSKRVPLDGGRGLDHYQFYGPIVLI